MLIGFGYKAGVGKDTSGDYLVKEYGFAKDSFARSLKGMCMELFSLSAEDVSTEAGKSSKLPKSVEYTAHLDSLVFSRVFGDLRQCGVDLSDMYVESDVSRIGRVLSTPREILQFIGTDVIRSYYPDYHLRTLLARTSPDVNTAVCDVRFPNEVRAVREAGGILVNVTRPTQTLAASTASHKSEVALDGFEWDYVVNNDADFSNLYKQLDSLMVLEGRYGR